MKFKNVKAVDGISDRTIVDYDNCSQEELSQIPLWKLEHNVELGDRGGAYLELERRWKEKFIKNT